MNNILTILLVLLLKLNKFQENYFLIMSTTYLQFSIYYLIHFNYFFYHYIWRLIQKAYQIFGFFFIFLFSFMFSQKIFDMILFIWLIYFVVLITLTFATIPLFLFFNYKKNLLKNDKNIQMHIKLNNLIINYIMFYQVERELGLYFGISTILIIYILEMLNMKRENRKKKTR